MSQRRFETQAFQSHGGPLTPQLQAVRLGSSYRTVDPQLDLVVRLADFISGNVDVIMADWVEFAQRSGPEGEALDVTELRDHAAAMLQSLVRDLHTPQTDAEQVAKGKGDAPPARRGDAATPATAHGAGRAESGFTVAEMTSEFRALRASVTRLWMRAKDHALNGNDLQDMIRFNEMIDQMLAESVAQFSLDIDRAREIFLSVLGDDLRRPLSAIRKETEVSLGASDLPERHRGVLGLAHANALRMTRMVDDLLDFTQGRLGSGIPVEREAVNLGQVVRDAVHEFCAAQPECALQVTASGDLTGEWDAARVTQVVTNLVGNAVLHGTPGTLISVTAEGEPTEVVLRVHNYGPPIAEADLPGLFSPYRRLHAYDTALRESGNVGLGLYIAERIVSAHGGFIGVRSSDAAGTLFTVRLPRAAPPRNTPPEDGGLDRRAGA